LEIQAGGQPVAVVVQETHYDPWGLELAGIGYLADPAKESKFTYNGKEKQDQFGLGWLDCASADYHARQVDPALGRMWAVDPLAGKFAPLSPYVYVANNPLLFVDPDGKELKVTFSGEGSRELFEKLVNHMFNGQFKVKLDPSKDKDGKVEDGKFVVGISKAKDGGDLKKLNEGAQAFYRGLKGVVDSKKIVDINIVNGKDGVYVGNYKNEDVDVGDISQLPAFNHAENVQYGLSQGGKLIHEIREQFAKELDGIGRGKDGNIGKNHAVGIDWEDRVNQNTRLPDGSGGGGFGTYTEKFGIRKDGTINYRIVRYTLSKTPLTKVLSVNETKQ
jgi:RHS repeat-associated protein